MENKDESKKRVLVVGNGFDLAIGRKTSYWDFYQSEYCPKRYPAPLIDYLNQNLEGENVRWLDLETALQNYAIGANKCAKKDDSFFTEEEKKVVRFLKNRSVEPVVDNYPAIVTGVSNFYEIERDLIRSGWLYSDIFGITRVPFELSELNLTRIERDRIALQKIEEGLTAYLNSLEYKHPESMNLADLIMISALEGMDSKIYSFNYTNISKVYANDDYRAEDYDEKIHYVHGSLKDNHIIIGAKDGDYGNYNFVQKAFDSQFGSNSLVRDLLEADVIDIYGHSLGDCDSQYFMPFFLQQVKPTAKKKEITIYTYDEKSKENIKSNIQKMTYNKLSWLYSLNQFQILTQKDMDLILEECKKIPCC